MRGRTYTAFGETKTLSEWRKDKRCNCKNESTIKRRLERGITFEDAILMPPKTKNGRKSREKCPFTEWRKCLSCPYPKCIDLKKPPMRGETDYELIIGIAETQNDAVINF